VPVVPVVPRRHFPPLFEKQEETGCAKVDLTHPGLHLQKLGVDLTHPGLHLQKLGVDLTHPGLHLQKLGVDLTHPGLHLQKLEVDLTHPGLHLQKLEVDLTAEGVGGLTHLELRLLSDGNGSVDRNVNHLCNSCSRLVSSLQI